MYLMYPCFCVGTVHMSIGIHRGQKRKLDLLELELQMAMSCFTWVLGTKLALTFSTMEKSTYSLKETFGVQIYIAQFLSSLPGTG